MPRSAIIAVLMKINLNFCVGFQAIVFIYLLRANVDALRRRRRRSSGSENVNVDVDADVIGVSTDAQRS